ncbi:MAG: cyclin family protein [bacterium]
MNFFIFLILCYSLGIANLMAMAHYSPPQDSGHQCVITLKEAARQCAAQQSAAKIPETEWDSMPLLKLIKTIETEDQNILSGKASITKEELAKKKAILNYIIATELCSMTGEKSIFRTEPNKQYETKIITNILISKLQFTRCTILYGIFYLENLLMQNTTLLRDFKRVSNYFIVCCLLASKSTEDKFFSNKYWASVFYKHFCDTVDQSEIKKIQATKDTLEIMNAIESLILTTLDWKMVITPQQFSEFVKKLCEKYKPLLNDTAVIFRSCNKATQKRKN